MMEKTSAHKETAETENEPVADFTPLSVRRFPAGGRIISFTSGVSNPEDANFSAAKRNGISEKKKSLKKIAGNTAMQKIR
jgi:hypothetical protein